MSLEVNKWLKSGAEVNEGLRLLNIYAPNPALEHLIQSNAKYSYLLKKALQPFITIDIQEKTAVNNRRDDLINENWLFLSSPSCPQELKILAVDKLTARKNLRDWHEELFNCETTEECYFAAQKVIENFIENQKITSEFTYYLEHNNLLGKHPIFETTKRIIALRKMSVVALLRRQKNLMENIWRIKNEIDKKDKPHLLIERENRMKQREQELQEINRLIKEYEQK